MVGVTPRATVIEQILARYHELVEPGGRNGSPGDGDQLPRVPATYTPDVKEVERLMSRLRDYDRHLWWHVSERYLRSGNTIKTRSVKKRVKGKGYITVHLREVVPFFSPRVDEKMVEAGLEKLASWWSLGHEPMLPKQVMVG